MVSNRALVANGWETNVIIQMFPYGPSKNKKKIYIRKKKKDYVYLGNVGDDEGGVNKYVKNMVGNFITELFYVICSDLNQLIKNSCFVVSLLLALSHLRKDDKYIKWEEHHINLLMIYTISKKLLMFIKSVEFPPGR